MRIFFAPNTDRNDIVKAHLCYTPELGIEGEPTFHVDPRSRQNEYIIIYVTHGIFLCEQYGKSCRVSENEYILLDLGVVHSFRFEQDVPSEIYWMHMKGNLVGFLMNCIDEITPLPLIDHDPSVADSLKTAIEMNSLTDAEPFAMSNHISNLLTNILEKQYRKKKMAEFSEKEYRFRTRFDQVLQSVGLRSLTLDNVCEQMHMNKYYFSHLFKQYYGMSPMKYLLHERITKAQNLLRSPSLKIASVAAECGFSSPEYFSNAFRRECGVSPEQYRNNCKMQKTLPQDIS